MYMVVIVTYDSKHTKNFSSEIYSAKNKISPEKTRVLVMYYFWENFSGCELNNIYDISTTMYVYYFFRVFSISILSKFFITLLIVWTMRNTKRKAMKTPTTKKSV